LNFASLTSERVPHNARFQAPNRTVAAIAHEGKGENMAYRAFMRSAVSPLSRVAVPFVVGSACALWGASNAHAQVKIVLPPIPKMPVYTPFSSAPSVPPFPTTGFSQAPSSASNSPAPLFIPPVQSTANIRVTGPRAKFEPAGNAVYHGASLPDTWSEDGLRNQIAQYNAAAGKKISVVTWFASAYENGRITSWRQNYGASLDRVKRLGALSLIKFSTQDYAFSSTHKMADLKAIAAGSWDDYFVEAAHTVRDFRSPVFISIDHEMNGNWYPYSQAYEGSTSTAADYVAAWRHIVSIFRSQGANNAAFVWSPNVPDVGGVPYQSYYPGDSYVDWVGISFYSGNSMSAMDDIYRQLAPRKPFFITEWATAPEKNRYNPLFPGEVAWVEQFFAALETRYPRVKAISWFNWQNGDGDYRLTRVPAQAQTYAKDISASRYLSSPGSQFVHSNAIETPRLDVVPREIIFREKTAPSTPAPVVPRLQGIRTERVLGERIGTEKVRVSR